VRGHAEGVGHARLPLGGEGRKAGHRRVAGRIGHDAELQVGLADGGVAPAAGDALRVGAADHGTGQHVLEVAEVEQVANRATGQVHDHFDTFARTHHVGGHRVGRDGIAAIGGHHFEGNEVVVGITVGEADHHALAGGTVEDAQAHLVCGQLEIGIGDAVDDVKGALGLGGVDGVGAVVLFFDGEVADDDRPIVHPVGAGQDGAHRIVGLLADDHAGQAECHLREGVVVQVRVVPHGRGIV